MMNVTSRTAVRGRIGWAALWLILALVAVVPRQAAMARDLGPTDIDRVQGALNFMRDNGYKAEAIRLAELYALGRITKGEFSDAAIGAETEGGHITINISRLGHVDRERLPMRWFQVTTELAETLIHELRHVEQWEGSMFGLVSDRDEVEGWSAAMQAIYDWITARERRMANASGADRRRYAEEMRWLTRDLENHIVGIRQYGAPEVKAANGRPLSSDELQRYVTQVRSQIQTVLQGSEPTSNPDQPTNYDLARLERERLTYWRQRVDDLLQRETALRQRVDRAMKAAVEAQLQFDFVERVLKGSRTGQLVLIKFCNDTTFLHEEAMRNARAAHGAALQIGKVYEQVRRFQCTVPAHLNDFQAALNDAVRMARDSGTLVNRADRSAADMRTYFEQLQNKGGGIDGLLRTFDMAKLDTFRRTEAIPLRQAAHRAVEAIAAMQPDVAAIARERREMRAAIEADRTGSAYPSLAQQHQRIAGDLKWKLTAGRVDRERYTLRKRNERANQLMGAIETAKPPTQCGDPQGVDAARADARYALELAVLQVDAIAQYRDLCARALGGGGPPPPANPGGNPPGGGGGIAVTLDSIECRGPWGDPGGGPRKYKVCDVRWTITNVSGQDLTWTSGTLEWRSRGEGDKGRVGYPSPTIAPGEAIRKGMQCTAYGPPFSGQWVGKGTARDRNGRNYAWNISGSCSP